MITFSTSPAGAAESLVKHRGLIYALTRRDVTGRYRGSALGLLWSFFNPLLMLAVYTFVFSVVFKARWSTEGSSKAEFALMLFAGLIIFNLFAECANKAPSLIVNNTNYVKKVVFPLEVLAFSTVGSALFHFTISLCVWLAAYYAAYGTIHPAIIFIPVIIGPIILMSLGVTWFLASLAVYLRDVSQIVSIITTILMFLSPIFYPASAVPEKYQYWLALNPLTPIIEMARNALLNGLAPPPISIGTYYLITTAVFALGYAWFQKTRKGFADVL